MIIAKRGEANQLLLIDADELANFGEERRSCTPEWNITKRDLDAWRNNKVIKCNEKTDAFGFFNT